MEIQELEIAIAPDGTVTCNVRGVKGQSCLDLTKDLEADLGGKILVRERTWEMDLNENVAEDEEDYVRSQG